MTDQKEAKTRAEYNHNIKNNYQGFSYNVKDDHQESSYNIKNNYQGFNYGAETDNQKYN